MEIFRQHRLKAAERERYLVYLDQCIDECLSYGQYVLGREADFMLPNFSALRTCAKLKGLPDIAGYFEGCKPIPDHLVRVQREVWDDCMDRFQERYSHAIDDGPRVKLTRGALIDVAMAPDGDLVGWVTRIPRDRANGLPAKILVKRGILSLGTLVERLKGPARSDVGHSRLFEGDLLAPISRKPIHRVTDGPIEVLRISSHAHVAALQRGELDIDYEKMANVVEGVERKMLVERAVSRALSDLESLIPDGEFKTIATACRLTGHDWKQTTLEYVDAEFRRDIAA